MGLHLPISMAPVSKSRCLQAKTGSKIFAVFNILLHALGSLLGAGALIYWLTRIVAEVQENGIVSGSLESVTKIVDARRSRFRMVLGIFSSAGALMVYSLISLVFAVFLVNGVFKKNPANVKLYIYYGLVIMGVSACSVVITMSTIKGTTEWIIASIAFLIIILYAMILAMIRRTYLEFEKEAQEVEFNLMSFHSGSTDKVGNDNSLKSIKTSEY